MEINIVILSERENNEKTDLKQREIKGTESTEMNNKQTEMKNIVKRVNEDTIKKICKWKQREINKRRERIENKPHKMKNSINKDILKERMNTN